MKEQIKRIAAVLMAGMLLAGCSASSQNAESSAGAVSHQTGGKTGDTRMEGEGFETAEEAAMAYIDGLIANDMDAMLSACAIESYVDHYDLEKDIERMGMYPNISVQSVIVPDAGEMARRINMEAHRAELIREIRNQYLSLVQPELCEQWFNQPNIPLSRYDSAMQLMKENFRMDEKALEDIRVVRVEELASLQTFSAESEEKMRNAIQERADALGADELTSVPIVVRAEGEDYYFIPDIVRYGDKWFVAEASGQIALFYDHSESAVSNGGLIPAKGVG